MKQAGYSRTPLAKKLGIKSGFKIRLINPPDYYFNLFTDFPEEVQQLENIDIKKNFIHLFAENSADVKGTIKELRQEIEETGMIWVSWYKKSSKIKTDLDENIIREIAFKNGLVDVKVCAVDEIWSGLKLVVRLKDRKK